MTQHDYNIANQTFPATRTDLNNALSSILSVNSGTSAPSTTTAHMLWADTTNSIIKQRNSGDSAWLHLWAFGAQGLVDQNGGTIYAADSVGTDSYAITLTPAPTAYAAGQVFRVKIGTANTGAATLNVNSLGAKTIKKNYNSDLETGDLLANQIIEVAYDGTNLQLLSPISNINQSYILLQDQKAANTAGGTFTTGAWRTRDLNTEVSDAGGHCSLSTNQFTLAAGTYRILAFVPFVRTGSTAARLQNVTDATTTLESTSAFSTASTGDGAYNIISGRFTIASSKAFEIQQQGAQTVSTSGFGFQTNYNSVEIYTSVELWKEK